MVATEEVRERFASAVVKMCDVFGKHPSQYDSIIEAYWSAVGHIIPIDRFEAMAKQFTSDMYKMPLPAHFLGASNNEPVDRSDPPQTAEEIETERIWKEGKGIVESLDGEAFAALYTDATMLVKASLGDFADVVGNKTLRTMVECKAYELAVKRRGKGRL